MADDQPNVVFVLTDDQGPWAAGCYGNPEIRTPNIDRMAATGTMFCNHFVATPVCSPSRATFLTGRVPSQHGIHEWINQGNCAPDSVEYLRDEVAYTDVLAANGYTCGISGKWHMGDSLHPSTASTSGTPTNGAVDHTTTRPWCATANPSTTRAT